MDTNTNFKKLNKNNLKLLVKEYKNNLIKQLADIKEYKLSKMKKGELVELVEKLFNGDKEEQQEPEKRIPEDNIEVEV